MLIDKISYTNPIKNINPGIKFTLSMMTLVFLLYTGSKVVFIFNLILFNLLLLFVVKVFEFMKKHNIMVKFIEKIENRAKKRSEGLATGEFIGLMLFVAIPFPGTGAWTGALIAALLQFERKKSFFYIGLGVIIAATVMTLASYGVISFFAPKH